MVHVWQNQVNIQNVHFKWSYRFISRQKRLWILYVPKLIELVAMNQIEGRLSDLIKKQRQSILEILAQVEVNIDYPEYDDVEDATTDFLLEQSKRIKKKSIDYLKQVHKVK